MTPANTLETGHSGGTGDALLARLLDHRFPPYWAARLVWSPAAILQARSRKPHRDMFGYDPATERILFNERVAADLHRGPDGWRARADVVELHRAADLLNDLAALDRPFVADMRDHRAGEGVCLPDGQALPVFQYNRQSCNTGGILWPLSRHFQEIGSPTYFGADLTDRQAFADKRDVVFWRGGATGHDRTGLRAIASLRAFAAGQIDHATCASRLRDVPRFALLRRFGGQADYDLAFALSENYPSPALFAYRTEPRLSRAQMIGARYQLAVGGNDCASNLPWLLGTNCLVLLQDYDWQTVFSAALEPWVHYVPIAADFADLQEKLAWARANLRDCAEIVAAATDMAARLSDPALESRLRAAVLDRYRRLVRFDQG